jgi:Mrp family chromosome partitioning ATPase
MMQSLASCLARRDERVLVLDGRLGEASDGGTPGLREYLSFSVAEADEVIRPGPLPGVDVLPAGKPVTCGDALATHRMRELIEELRSRYTLILLQGPSLHDPVDLSILAAFTEGMIIVAERPPVSLPVARKTLASLVRLEAPLIGQVVLTDRAGS